MNLLEQYKQRLSISESLYSRNHNNQRMDNNRKLMIAQCLKNTSAFLNEAFTEVDATQRSAMGTWKKFCLLNFAA